MQTAMEAERAARAASVLMTQARTMAARQEAARMTAASEEAATLAAARAAATQEEVNVEKARARTAEMAKRIHERELMIAKAEEARLHLEQQQRARQVNDMLAKQLYTARS